nr:hypothetical protein MACL_00000152 [Theileria orientalis]
MVDGSRVDRQPSGEKNTNTKLEKVSDNKMRIKAINDKAQPLELQSATSKRGTKSRKRRKGKGKKARKAVEQSVSFTVSELLENSQPPKEDNSQSEDVITSPDSGTEFSSDESSDSNNEVETLAISETTNFELNEIYEAIDSINKLCLEPIKMEIRKDYIETKARGAAAEGSNEHRYSADINIVLSSRKDTAADTVYMSIGKEPSGDEFALRVENVTDSSEPITPKDSFSCCNLFNFRRIDSDVTRDSVRSLDNITTPSKTSDDKADSSAAPGMCELNLSLQSPNGSVNVNSNAFKNTLFECVYCPCGDDQNIDDVCGSHSDISCFDELSIKSMSSVTRRQSNTSFKTDRSFKSIMTDKSVTSIKSVKSDRSNRSVRSIKSFKSDSSRQSIKSVNSVKSITSIKSNRSDKSINSRQSVTSLKSVKSDNSAKQPGSVAAESAENQESKDAALQQDQTPYCGRTLFYSFHGQGNRAFSRSDSNLTLPYPIKDPRSMNPLNLGFDSVASLHKSMNAPSEVIIKAPVTIGGSVCFRSRVDKCVLSEDKFITDSVFQINWLNTRKTRRKRSLLQC